MVALVLVLVAVPVIVVVVAVNHGHGHDDDERERERDYGGGASFVGALDSAEVAFGRRRPRIEYRSPTAVIRVVPTRALDCGLCRRAGPGGEVCDGAR